MTRVSGLRRDAVPTRRHILEIDVIVGVLLAVVVAGITALFADGWATGDRPIDWVALVLVVVVFLVLGARRTKPLLTLTVVTAGVTWYLWVGYPYGPILGAFLIAAYTMAMTLPFPAAVVATGLATAVMLTHVFVHPNAIGGWAGLIPGAAWAVVPFTIGVSVRATRDARASEREEALRQHLSDQRLQLAQEIHDVVGHGLAAIQLQADIALHVDEEQPPRTRLALESISRASKAAFDELASTLNAIHPQRSPTSRGIDDISELCRRVREAGVEVDLVVEGQGSHDDERVELAAYRVVQEALTNVIRHSEVRSAVVSVAVKDTSVDVRVTNPGTYPTPSVAGLGVDGMRRRVEGLGGSFDVGPAGNVFQVVASIPQKADR